MTTEAEWKALPVGRYVRYWPRGQTRDINDSQLRSIRARAYYLGSGTLVVPLMGIPGAVPTWKVELLDEVNKKPEPAPKANAPATPFGLHPVPPRLQRMMELIRYVEGAQRPVARGDVSKLGNWT